jgi:type III restriction enzyme
MSQSIDHLIINNPFETPQKHWYYDREKRLFRLLEGRRLAGYLTSSGTLGFDDPGIFKELDLVNRIRQRVDNWRNACYPGVTGITKKLLEHWNDIERKEKKFFFCQLEAIETLIWISEAPEIEKHDIQIPNDGGPFRRLCSKMATGTGKTIVMGMLIAWHVLNKITYPTDSRFSKYFLIVAPGLTVKKRLEVLYPSSENNIYKEFDIIPTTSYESLRMAKIVIHNWHTLMQLDDKPRSVVKKGPETDEAFANRILVKNSSGCLNVINDEAHHAWRIKTGERADISKEEVEEATLWMEGLDRIHRVRGINMCYDFSATPYIPTGKGVSEETLYGWIVSDFSLNDAIESGLVKTPRAAIKDDARVGTDHRSRFYHIYMQSEVKSDLNRKADPNQPLPDLIKNAYFVLGKDWSETRKEWCKEKSAIPPVMITVCNRTETASRIEYSFRNKRFEIEELDDVGKMLHIDSKVLAEAEIKNEDEMKENGSFRSTSKVKGEELREIVTTIGKVGKPGHNIQNVIAVQMLSEGWDAKNVTHIMGLRAFTSQLLCEQVVGRGLRRLSYQVNSQNFFDPEHVIVLGIPFTFLPVEGYGQAVSPPPKPTTCIEPDVSKKVHEITWPKIIRIDRIYNPKLSLNWNKISLLTIRSEDTSLNVDLAPMLEGKPHLDKLSKIQIEELGSKYRLQTSIFKIAREVYEEFKPSTWIGNKEYLLIQIVNIVEQFLRSKKIKISNTFWEEEFRRRIIIVLNMIKIVHHIWSAIAFQNVTKTSLIFDSENPIRSTSDMMPWYTTKPAEPTKKSHVSHAVADSRWEEAAIYELENNDSVVSWVKNDHLGFDISYIHQGTVHKYWPDFLIKLKSGLILILEIKGMDTEKDRTKRKYLDEWVNSVNEDGRFGNWAWAVAFAQSEVRSIIREYDLKSDDS